MELREAYLSPLLTFFDAKFRFTKRLLCNGATKALKQPTVLRLPAYFLPRPWPSGRGVRFVGNGPQLDSKSSRIEDLKIGTCYFPA